MLNVTLASHSPYVSGAENMLVNLAAELLDGQKFSPTVLVPNANAGSLRRSLRERSIPWRQSPPLRWYLYETPQTQKSYARQALAVAEQYAELYWRTNADIVVVNTLVNVESALGAQLAGLPYFLWVHGIIDAVHVDNIDQFKATMDRLVLDNASGVACCSRWTERYFDNHGVQNLQTIHNWTSLQSAKGISRGNRLCVVTTLEPHKDTETVIRAVAKLKRSGLSVGLDIYGGGPMRAYLEDLIATLEVSDLVALHGRTEDPSESYAKALAVIVPSIIEPFGLVALEAMAAGAPVIVSATGGLLEVVQDNVSGLHFETSNAEDLARKISILVTSPDLRKELAEGGRDRARSKFSGSLARRAFENALTAAHHRFKGHDAAGFDVLRLIAGEEAGINHHIPIEPGMAEELAAIKASSYWRIGAPLRSVLDRMPKVRRLIKRSLMTPNRHMS